MKNIKILSLIFLSFLSCSEDELVNNPSVSDQNLTYFYDRKENGNLQIYSFDGEQEVNLTKDNNYDYWWVRVSPDKTKFL